MRHFHANSKMESERLIALCKVQSVSTSVYYMDIQCYKYLSDKIDLYGPQNNHDLACMNLQSNELPPPNFCPHQGKEHDTGSPELEVWVSGWKP